MQNLPKIIYTIKSIECSFKNSFWKQPMEVELTWKHLKVLTIKTWSLKITKNHEINFESWKYNCDTWWIDSNRAGHFEDLTAALVFPLDDAGRSFRYEIDRIETTEAFNRKQLLLKRPRSVWNFSTNYQGLTHRRCFCGRWYDGFSTFPVLLLLGLHWWESWKNNEWSTFGNP